MKIAIIGSILRPTLPASLGGISVFNYTLSTGLTRIKSVDDEIILFASGDSQTEAKLYPVIEKSIVKDTEDASAISLRQRNIENTNLFKIMQYIREEKFDIVHHSHYNFLPVALSASLGLKTVLTVHVNRDIDFIDNIKLALGANINKVNFVSISQTHRQIHPDLNFYANIYNGIDTSLFKYNENPEDYVCWIGRITREKGLLEAVKASKKAGKILKFAGPISDQSYFDSVVAEGGDRAVYEGVVDKERRNQLLGNAKALLFPIDWEEPFGLTLIEAMACGTPVIAFNRGAVSEIVKSGQNGFIVEKGDILKMAEAILNIEKIERKKCLDYVEIFFSAKVMTKNYYNLYNKLLNEK